MRHAMADADLVLEAREGDVVTLTLNDPERRNAMSEAMGRAFEARCARLEGDASLRALILAGAGRAFSAGGDFDMLERLTERAHADPGARAEVRDFMRAYYAMFLCVRRLPCPTIAALHGHAIGAGLGVALGCDIRLVAREAKLGLNFVRVGLHPGMGTSWTLPRLVGPSLAAELLYTGRLVHGEEAVRIGLASRALPAAEIPGAARALAAEIAASAPLAVRGARRSLAESGENDLESQLEREAAEQASCYASTDMREGLAAARASRAPSFRGR
jgi:enoyl-CoA hydratase/carnithine racemase